MGPEDTKGDRGSLNSPFWGNKREKNLSLLPQLPKVELHVHIGGTLGVDLIKQLAEQYRVELPDNLFDAEQRRVQWNTFFEFIQAYDAVGRVICCPEAMTTVAYEYLKKAHKQGAIYVELQISPDDLVHCGLGYKENLAAVVKGIEEAREAFGIECRIIATLVRHNGYLEKEEGDTLEDIRQKSVSRCERQLEDIINNPHPLVVGLGLAGDEINFPPHLFHNAFRRAAKAGLKLTAHAGEWTNARDVEEAIVHLGVQRVDHGIHAAFDAKVLALVKARKIHLAMCPMSNRALQTRRNYPGDNKHEAHPHRIIHEAGIRYSISSDDPPFFGTDILDEYVNFSNELGLNCCDLLMISLIAIEDSFADETLKEWLRQQLYNFAKEHEIPFDIEGRITASASQDGRRMTY